eukprot:693839-Hanusia_phi.AAC.3
MHVQADELMDGTLRDLVENFRPDFLFFSLLSKVQKEDICHLTSVWKICRELGISAVILHKPGIVHTDVMQLLRNCSNTGQCHSDMRSEWFDTCLQSLAFHPLISSHSCDHSILSPSPESDQELNYIAYVDFDQKCRHGNQSATGGETCELFWSLKKHYGEQIRLLVIDEQGLIDRSLFRHAKMAIMRISKEGSGLHERLCEPSILGIKQVYDVVSGQMFVIHNFDTSVSSNLENGTHVVTYKTGDEQALVAMIDHFLENTDERIRIASQGMQHVCLHNTMEEYLGHALESLYQTKELLWHRCKAIEGTEPVEAEGEHSLLDMPRERMTISHGGAEVSLDVIHKSTWDKDHHKLDKVSCLEDDCDLVLKNFPQLKEPHATQTRGIFIALFENMTLVHDGVFCNATHTVTAFKCKHETHPNIPEGCLFFNSDKRIL